jgi:hypothetical protein
MKSILLILFITFSTIAYSQGMKIEWEDQVGREFSITVPSGTFSYGMIQGDNLSYDYKGNVSKVGAVYISYDYKGNVSKVGGLYLKYDYNGKVTGTSGSVN